MIKTTRQEWRQIQNAQMQKYAGMEESDIPERGYAFAHDHFYIIRNYGLGALMLRIGSAQLSTPIWRVKDMEKAQALARRLGQVLGRAQTPTEDGIAVLLTLETEENFQEFLTWLESLGKTPTPQACFEKAIEIWEANGPWPEETDEET